MVFFLGWSRQRLIFHLLFIQRGLMHSPDFSSTQQTFYRLASREPEEQQVENRYNLWL